MTVHHNSKGKTSRSLVGLAKSPDAKGGREDLTDTQELSTSHFTFGAKPLLGTPVDGKEESNTVEETKRAVVSTQSMVY